MATPYMENDPRFYKRLVEVSQSVGLTPEDILVVMALESGINASIHNNNYGGLTQMSNKTLKGLGYDGDVSDFSKEPAFKQLDVIEKQIKRLLNIIGGKFDSATQYYIGNLLPVALKLQGVRDMDPKTIIVSENPTEPHLPNVTINKEKIYYLSNKGLDLDGDGSITYKDIDNFLEKKRGESHYENAIAQLSNVNNTQVTNNNQNVDSKESGILNQINVFLDKMLAQAEIKNKNLTISVIGNDINSSIEFARVLAMSLREEFGIKTTSHKLNNMIEIACTFKPNVVNEKIIKAFSEHMSNCFYDKTKKIGGVRVETVVNLNKKSSYDILDNKIIIAAHRKFLTKFI